MTTKTFNFTGGPQTFVVPVGVTSIAVTLVGARGGSSSRNAGRVTGTLAVTPGQSLQINVGGNGAIAGMTYGPGGWNGGGDGGGAASGIDGGAGGGGASDIRQGGTALANRVAVAGGSGGSSEIAGGGAGGGSTGGTGVGTNGGSGGTQAAGGAAHGTGGGPTNGALGVGGTGGTNNVAAKPGGGGGGGGYYGGGGGGLDSGTGLNASGGGGGSNYTGGLTSASSSQNIAAPAPTVVLVYNLPPNAPGLVSPIGGAYVDTTIAQQFQWTFSDADPGDTQSAFSIRWRVGAGAWTTVGPLASTVSNYTFAAGYFTSVSGSSVEWQVQTVDAGGATSAWSSSAFFNATAPPAAPVMTAPAASATVPASVSVTWTASNQKAFEVRRVADSAGTADNTTVYSDATVVDGAARSYSLAFDTNSRDEHVQLRVQDATSSLWSAWVDHLVHVSYVLPPVPTIVVTSSAANASVTVTITNPASTGGQPASTTNDVHMVTKDGVDVMVGSLIALNSAFTYYMPAEDASYYAVAHGANGTASVSLPSAARHIGIAGAWLLDPTNPQSSKLQFLLNDVGAAEDFSIEAVATDYAGREFPVVDYGDGSSQSITVTLTTIHSGPEAGKYGSMADLRALISLRKVLLYRDARGRRLYGFISAHPLQDAYAKQSTSITLTVTDYPDGV